MKIDGGCHCGFITYEAEADPEKVTICNCTDCQTLSGSAFRTVLPVSGETFKFLTGKPRVYVKPGDSGNKREQTFCPECGAPIYSAAPGDGAKIYSLRVGTIRQRADLAPKRRIWTQSELPWLDRIASLPGVEKQ